MSKKGSKTVSIEIILLLAETESGSVRRDSFISKERKGKESTKEVRKPFLDRLAYRKRSLDLKDKKNKGSSVFSVEKCISELRKNGYIEDIPANVSHPREYKLKCDNLYDLLRILSLIIGSDRVLPNNGNSFERLWEFLRSQYFRVALDRYIFDLLYYFDLWDERLYPITKASYSRMMGDSEFLFRLPIIYRLDLSRPITGHLLEGRENQYVYPDYPNYFRNNFPGEGPALYEEFLRKEKVQSVLLDRLAGDGQSIEGFIFLSEFVMKYLGGKFNLETFEIDGIDFWFNSFWYGPLEEMADTLRRYAPREDTDDKVCILDLQSITRGDHQYENFKPLIVAKKLIHLSLCNPANIEFDELSYNVVPHNDLMSFWGHYPKYTEYPQWRDSIAKRDLFTAEGRLFAQEIIDSISKDTWFPVSLISFIEYFLERPSKLSISPSLALHDSPLIAGKMSIFDKMLKLETGMVSENERIILSVSSENRSLLISHRISAESNRIERISAWSIIFPVHRSFVDGAPISNFE